MRKSVLLVGGLVLPIAWCMGLAAVSIPNDTFLPESYIQEDIYVVPFVSAYGREMEAEVTRRMSVESVPFWVEYRIQADEAEAWFATTTAGDYISIPEQLASATGRVPSFLIDDFSDGDMVSPLGTPWQYRLTDPTSAVWGVTSDSHGYMLPLSQCFSDDDTIQTDYAQLDLSHLDAQGFDGLYLVLKGYGGHLLDVRLDGLVSSVQPRMPGEWYDTWSSEPVVYYLPFGSFPGIDRADLSLLELDLHYKNGCSGIFIYEVGLYANRNDLVERHDPHQAFSVEFEFTDNLTSRVITLAFTDAQSVIYTYSEELTFRLHSKTRIRLGRTDESSPNGWSVSTGDSSDASYRVDASEAAGSVLTSDYPNVLDVVAEQAPGENARVEYKAMIIHRDGVPFRIRGSVISPYYIPDTPDAIKEQCLDDMAALGVNGLGILWTHFYTPQAYIARDFDIRPVYHELTGGPSTRSPQHVANLVRMAHERGMSVNLMCGLNTDPRSAFSQYGPFSIRPSSGFFKLDGEEGGFASFVLDAATFAELHEIEILTIGIELVHLETPAARSYWTDLIRQVRSVYSGLITYEHYSRPHYDRNATYWPWDIGEYGIPYEKLDFIGSDAYHPYATSPDDTIEHMYENIVSGFRDIESGLWHDLGDYMQRMADAYEKPYLVTEIGIFNSDGSTTMLMPEHTQGAAGLIRDDEEARRAMSAYFRAVCDLIAQGLDYEGFFIWEWPIQSDVAFYAPDNWWLVNLGIRGKPVLFQLVQAFFINEPLDEGALR